MADFTVSKSHKCPSCGGKLIFEPDTQELKCDFCGNSYSPEKLELMEQIIPIDVGEADAAEDDKCEVVCDNCGAVLITDNNTVSTFCAFCGSPAVISRRLQKQFRPQYIIPFKVTKEEAAEKFVEFAKTRKYVPRDYFDRKNLDNIQGIYVPFWVVSSRCQGNVRGEGYKKRVASTDKYVLMADFDVKYNNVPFDGSAEIADDLMEAVEPFDISQREAFNTSYLQGFYAQKFNLTTEDMSDRIMVRMEKYARETAALSFHEYDSIKTGACAIRPYDLEQTYALYPIWFLNYRYNGGNYRIAINGQTGKADGYLPVDRFKRSIRLIAHRIVDVLCCILAILPVAALLFGLFMLGMHLINSGGFMIALLVAVCISLPLIGMGVFGNRFKFDIGGKTSTLSEMMTRPITRMFLKRRESYDRIYNESNMPVGYRPSASEYYDPSAKVNVEVSELFSNSENLVTGDN